MTNENHAEGLQEATSFSELLEEGGDNPIADGPAQDQETKADAGNEQPKTDGEPVKEEPKAAPAGDDALKKTRDVLSRVRNDQVQSYRVLKALEDDGVYTRAEMAEKAGMTVGEVNRLLDQKPTAAPGEPEYQQTLINAFEQDVKNPVVFNALARAYGGRDALDELKQAYIWAHRVDPSVASELENVTPEEMTVHVFDTGAKYLEEYREAQSEGGLTPLEMYRRAKAMKAEKQDQKAKEEATAEPKARQPKPNAENMPTLASRVPQAQTVRPEDEWMRRLSS